MSKRIPNARLTHVGMYVRDLKLMTAFYCRVLGMVQTDGAPFMGRELSFLSRDPDEHHQIVLIQDPNRREGSSSLNQVSFRVDDLEALRAFHALLSEESEVAGLEGRNHGNSWSLYFYDPEGNKIELYVPTPWHVSQPWRAPLDLRQSVDQIVEDTRRQMEANPTSRPMSEWSEELRKRLS